MRLPMFFPSFVLGIFVISGSVPVTAGEPTEQIRSAINKGVQILRESRLDMKKDRPKIIQRLREIVYPLFDFKEMAKRSLGSHWRQLTPKQQEEFSSLFTSLLERSYADKIDLYDGQKVIYTQENVDQDYAEVDTKVIGKNGESFSVNYKLLQVGGKWRIYDVVVEDISVVNNYRSQFHRVIVNSSFQELIDKLKEKVG
jgi:phospholipid transport system substrate-binding protein